MLDETRDELADEIVGQDCPGPIVVPMSEIGAELTEDRLRTVRETAYRRGYTQGVAAAARAIEAGHGVHRVRDWLASLMDWRYKRHGGKVEYPRELAAQEPER